MRMVEINVAAIDGQPIVERVMQEFPAFRFFPGILLWSTGMVASNIAWAAGFTMPPDQMVASLIDDKGLMAIAGIA